MNRERRRRRKKRKGLEKRKKKRIHKGYERRARLKLMLEEIKVTLNRQKSSWIFDKKI